MVRIACALVGNPNCALPTVVFHDVYETRFKALLESKRRSKLCFSPSRNTRPAEAFRLNCIGPVMMLRPAFPHVPAAGTENAAGTSQRLDQGQRR